MPYLSQVQSKFQLTYLSTMTRIHLSIFITFQIVHEGFILHKQSPASERVRSSLEINLKNDEHSQVSIADDDSDIHRIGAQRLTMAVYLILYLRFRCFRFW